MSRRPFSFRSLAVAATTDTATATSSSSSSAAMSYRPYFIGGRPQIRRSYCDGDHPEFVSGDSHFSAIRDANRGFRPSYNAVPPPPQYVNGQQFYGYGSRSQRPGPPAAQRLPERRPYKHLGQVRPPFGNNQQFRPQQMPQQFRPRATRPPDYREWEYRKPGVPAYCEHFRVLSYNILADYLATDHWHKLYYHIPRYIMDWNWRKRNIIFELGLWSADILCFQEVDRFQDIEAELKPRGYNGIWKMRTGDPSDGCAIFWRVSRFKLLHEESIEYNRIGLRDNVAQISVFESLNGQNSSNGPSTLSTSSVSSNRVVVCNIHVLFNPKRGDVKLGQIRVLLERAHAVSKLWDDIPIIICGDFNCTPKSPMYNFISEQKLDLSELARDKVSGQVSAEIRPPRPAYPDFRTQAADNSAQPFAVDFEKVGQGGLPSDAQKLAHLHVSANAPSTESYSKPGCSILDENSESCINEGHRSRRGGESPSHDVADSPAMKSMPTSCVPRDLLNQSVSSAEDDIESPASSDRSTNDIYILESSSENICTTEGRDYLEPDTSKLEEPSKKLFPNSHNVSLSEHVGVAISVSAVDRNDTKPSNVRSPYESTSLDTTLDEKFESLSLDEVVVEATDEISRDCESFLSELRFGGQSSFPTDVDSSSPNQKLHSHGDENLKKNHDHMDILDIGNLSSSPSVWTPAEIQIATGSADCKVMEHPLKLTSAYAEVENSSGLRDSSCEPFVTSYHRRFLGTVDYIWHTEGLQTAKVLAPIPKHVMQQTRGFPTKKWGSDHIALVSEFAFTKGTSSENSTQ